MFSRRYIYIIGILGLTACGDGGESTPIQEASTVLPQPTSLVTVIDLTGQAGATLTVAKQVNGVQTKSRAAVSDSFANAIGTLRHVSSDNNVEGNLTIGVTASDTDVLKKVSLYLPNVGREFVLCSDSCVADFQSTITGFNPQLASEIAGPLRIELIVEDNLGNSAIVDALNINWQPIQISAINASRENGIVAVSWSGNSSLERYNLYAATELGLTTLNAQSLDNGAQRLAIKGTSATFSDADASKDYHLLITGIDNGGESGESSPYIIPRTIGIPNQSPVANNDSFQVNEDETLTVNVLDNDFDPDGQLITVDSVLLQPVNGSLSTDTAGNFTYIPNANYHGIDSASYRLIDVEGATAQATVFFDVLAVNDNPIAVGDTYGVEPSGKISAADTNLLSNDSDIDGDNLQVLTTPITAPQQGTVIINADGSFSYQSFGVLSENDQFVYQVVDGFGGMANATVTILPNGNILPPIAHNDNYQIDEDQTLVIASANIGILANDSDPNDLAFQLLETLLTQPQNGQLNLSLDGTFTYIPNSNFVGVDQFQYQIKNAADILAQAFVTITVNPVADIPIALDDNYQAVEDVELLVAASSGLLINDVDFDNSILKVNTTPVNRPEKGTLVLAADGSFSYMANADFSGVDSFTYQVINAEGLTNTANVNIVISAINDAPIAINDSVTINEDNSVVVDVLANDSDKENDEISLISFDIENGTAAIVNGKLDITPALNFHGQLNVSYTVSDTSNATSIGQLVVTVLPINDVPLALNDSYSLSEDSILNVLVTHPNQLLVNDSDVDGDTLTINTSPIINVSNGSLTLNNDGSFSYTPNSNFNGVDSFSYEVSDGNGGTAQASVTLTINNINDIPVAVADSYNFTQNTTLSILVTDANHLLVNDNDLDGDTLTVDISPVVDVNSGNLTLNANGSFSYTPNNGFNGVDSFTYRVTDGKGGSAQASVTLTSVAVNILPVAVADSYSFNEDYTWVRLVTDGDQLLSNDSDGDGDALTVNTTPVSNVSSGSLTLNSDGSFSYIPDANTYGIDSFTYEISDGNGGTAQASVTLIVHAINDIPVIVNANKSYTLDEDISLTKLTSDGDNLLSDVSDIEGDGLTVTLVSDVGSNGNLTLNNDGSFSYSPNENFNGADSFIYQVNDGNGGTAQANVSLTIQAVNDAPTAENQVFNVDEDKTHGDAVGLIIASDIEGDALSYSLSAGDTDLFAVDSSTGAITVNGNRPLDYETKAQHIVTVTISDEGSPIAESVDITIAINVNDIAESGVLTEVASFGRPVIGSLELTGVKTQAQLVDSVRQGNIIYFVGSIDNVDKDIYMVAYTKDGVLDTSFGDAGVKIFDFGQHEYAKAITHNGIDNYVAFNRDDGTYTEVCFIKLDNSGDLDSGFGTNGVRCTEEQKILSINDVAYNEGNSNIFAVGKVEGTDDDFLMIEIDESGDFIDHTPVDTTDSPHIIEDISAAGLDDEGIALYSPHNNEVVVTGNVLTANGDSDIFALIFDNGVGKDSFNNGNAKFYDISGQNLDDEVKAIGGISEAEHIAHLVGSTVLPSGAKDAFILTILKNSDVVTSFGPNSNGIAIYDVDGDAGVGTGSAEFTSIVAEDEKLYVSGTLFDGKSKPFTSRIIAADGIVDTANYGINGYQQVSYASGNAFALSMTLGNESKMWLPGYVEAGSDKNMIISVFDSNGNAYDVNDIVDGKKTLTHSSVPSDDIVAQVIEIQSGVQKDKFLVASTADDGTNQYVIMTRLTQAGLLDTSFDEDGHKQLKIGTSATVNGAFEVADGQFIIYGDVTEASSTNGYVARIDQNGLLDASFATNGIYTTSAISATNINFNQAKVDNVGRIIAVGNYENGSTSAFVLRLTEIGALDTGFNNLSTPGYVIGSATDDYFTVLIDTGNNIYAAGNRDSGDKDMLLVKYSAAGTLDTALNSSGELIVDVNAGVDDSVKSIAFDSNNNLYLVGNNLAATEEIAIVKTSTSGALDSSFSGDGIASFVMAPDDAQMISAVVDSNDNIVVVGFGEIFGVNKYMTGRIKPDGTLDNSFDSNGYSIDALTCGITPSQLTSIVLLNNSSFVVAGQCYVDSTFKNNIAISHYQLN